MPQVAAVKQRKKTGAVTSFVVGLILLAVVIGVIVFLYWLFVPSVSSVVDKANTDDTNGNYSQAVTALKQALPRTIFSSSDRENVLLGLGTTEFDIGDYNQSVTYYQQADKLKPHQESTLFELGQAAQSAQNNAVELSADKQLLPIVQADEEGPTRQNDISDIQNRIAELEK